MGLTSLSCLNRAGTYTYWDDSWDSIKLYRRYYYNNFFFRLLIADIFSGSFFNLIYNNKLRIPGYFSKYRVVYSYSYKNIFFGKIWFIKYQGWYIIILYYYNLKFIKKVKKRFKLIKTKNIINKKFKYSYYLNIRKNFNFNF